MEYFPKDIENLIMNYAGNHNYDNFVKSFKKISTEIKDDEDDEEFASSYIFDYQDIINGRDEEMYSKITTLRRVYIINNGYYNLNLFRHMFHNDTFHKLNRAFKKY